jgi:hypothetical protein
MQDHENMSFWFKGFVQQIIKRKENIYFPIPIILEHMPNLSSSLITPDSLKWPSDNENFEYIMDLLLAMSN